MKNFYCRKCGYMGRLERGHPIPEDPDEKVCGHTAIGTGSKRAGLGKICTLSDGSRMNCLRSGHKPVTTLSHKNKVAKRKLVRMGVEV